MYLVYKSTLPVWIDELENHIGNITRLLMAKPTRSQKKANSIYFFADNEQTKCSELAGYRQIEDNFELDPAFSWL